MAREPNSNRARSTFNAFFRHRRKILIISCSIVAITILALIIWPRSYESEVKLFVRIGRENVTLDPTANTGQTVAFQKQQEEEINSVLEILNSRETLQRVVDILGPDEILTPSSDEPGSGASAQSIGTLAKSAVGSAANFVLTTTGLRDPISDREVAIRKLEKRRKATAGRRSGVVTLNVRSLNPKAAQRLAATTADVFLEHHVGLSRTAGSHEFFSEQAQLLHDELAEAADLLRDRKTEYGIVTVEGTQGKLLQEASSIELVALETARTLSYGETRIDELQRRIDELPETVVTAETNGTNVSRAGLEAQLFALKLQEQEMQSRMTDKHPAIAQIRIQRENMERAIELQVPNRTSATQALNPLRETLRAELLQEKANVAALKERKSILTEQLASLQQKAETLNAREVELAELQRNVSALEAKYNAHVNNLEQARVDKALQAESISSINIVQPATLVERPVTPAKRLGLAAGLLLAMVCSVGTALGLELLDPTIRTEEHVEDNLELPLIAAIPSGESRSTRRTSDGQPLTSGDTTTPYQVMAGRVSELNGHEAESSPTKAVTVAIVNCDSSLPESVAAELAVNAIGMNDEPVLLVDADNLRRRVGDRFDANGEAGLSDVLSGSAQLDSCVRESGFSNLSLLSAGSSQASATAVDLRKVRRQLEPVADKYSLMIADLPAASHGGADVSIAREFDAVLLVVEAERTRIDSARRIKRQLTEGGANVLGCILHGQKEYIPNWLKRFV